MSFLTTLVGSKVAVSAITLGGLALGGTTAAAYTGTLPQPLQHVAHQFVGAPLTSSDVDGSMPVPSASDSASPDVSASAPLVLPTDGVTASPTATPVGPDATGPAAYGLCTAYTHGGVKAGSVAYTALVTAAQAKGAADIPAYCTAVIDAKHPVKHSVTPKGTEDSAVPTPEPTKESHKSSHVKVSTHHTSDDSDSTDSTQVEVD